MRMMKLAWIMMVAFLLGSASAHAVTIKKRIEAPGLPPQIWGARWGVLRDQDLASSGRRVFGREGR
jgi:hypothetical protein